MVGKGIVGGVDKVYFAELFLATLGYSDSICLLWLKLANSQVLMVAESDGKGVGKHANSKRGQR